MTRLRLFLVIAFITVFLSCNPNYRLTESDLKLNPYKTGDTLVFQSDKGESDTLVIYSSNRQVLRERCYSFLTCIFTNLTKNSWEGFYVNANKPREFGTGESILTIRVEPNGAKTIYFGLVIKNACWYSDSENDLAKFNSLPITTITTRDQTFSDVLTIVSNNLEYQARKDFIENIYWSKSFGFVGFNKLNGDKWTVTKK